MKETGEHFGDLRGFERELKAHRRALTFLLQHHGSRAVLLAELRRASAGDWFCSGATFRNADADLRKALSNCRIRSARGLTEWLLTNEDFGVERGGTLREGMQFKVP